VRFPRGPKIGDEKSALAALTSPKIDEPSIVETSSEDPNAIREGAGEASITSEGPERIEIAVRCDKPGVLLLADRMAPGWTVTIDGVSKPALTVDYLFRGVVVEEGNHVIVWSYQAPGFRSGILISASVGVILAALLIASASRRAAKRQPAVPNF
jgi:uncharacterized membrane protein YfhO